MCRSQIFGCFCIAVKEKIMYGKNKSDFCAQQNNEQQQHSAVIVALFCGLAAHWCRRSHVQMPLWMDRKRENVLRGKCLIVSVFPDSKNSDLIWSDPDPDPDQIIFNDSDFGSDRIRSFFENMDQEKHCLWCMPGIFSDIRNPIFNYIL